MSTETEHYQEPNKIPIKTIVSIVAVALVAFVGILAETSLNVAFPTLERDFNVSMGTIQWVTTAYLLVVAIIMPTSSYTSRRFQSRHLFIAALIFFTVGDIVSLVAPNFAMLLTGRLIQGIGTGIAIPMIFSLILAKIPHSKMGVWMGFGGMIVSIAPALGPTYGGLLTGTIGWRWIFAIILIIPIVLFPIGMWAIEKEEKQHPGSFDFLNFIILGIVMTSAIMAINSLAEAHFGWGWLAAFVITLIAFIWRSKVSKKQLIDLNVFKSPTFTLSVLVYCLLQFANLGINFIIPQFLQVTIGLSATLAGFTLIPGSLIGSLSQGPIGALYDRQGPKWILLGGNAVFLVASVVLALVTKHLGFLSITLLYIVFTFGRQSGFATTMTNSLAQLSPQDAGSGNAWFTTTSQFAASAGTAAASLVATRSSDLTHGTQNNFLMYAIIAVIIFICYAFILNRKVK